MFLYNKYQYGTNSLNTSVHIRTQIFFVFIKLLSNFFKPTNKKSFVKFEFYTFQGIKKIVREINTIKTQKPIFKKHEHKDKILTKLEDSSRLFDKDFISIYYNLIKQIKTPEYKIYLISILHHNAANFSKRFVASIVNATRTFKIKWYTKVHNSSFSSAKNTTILFLRSTKHFNKGRYSRNRQLYRTGVY
jgi:hypothetical protein